VDVAFHPEAREELAAAADWYAGILPGLGHAFLARVEEAIAIADTSPLVGAPVGAGLRRIFVRRFPYFVLYQVTDSTLTVLAVGHFRRRPGFWAPRSAE
jgi:toxin ParE1/3/4